MNEKIYTQAELVVDGTAVLSNVVSAQDMNNAWAAVGAMGAPGTQGPKGDPGPMWQPTADAWDPNTDSDAAGILFEMQVRYNSKMNAPKFLDEFDFALHLLEHKINHWG